MCYKWRSYQADRPLVVTWGWFTSGPTPNYQWSTVIYIWCANGGSPTVGQQRLSGHANGGPTTHLSLVYRWANGGPTEAHRWLATVGPTVGQQRPTGGNSHRWANRGSLDKPTVGHRWLPPLAQQRTYRWCTVGPPVASHRWPNRGPPVASHRWANRGSLDKPPVGHRWLPPLAHQYTYRWPTVGPPE